MAVTGLSAPLYFDHNINPRLARDLRRHGFDAVHSKEIGYDQAEDEDHRRWAAAAGRVLFTFDLDDYPVLAAQWFEREEAHEGIIISIGPPRLAYGELLRRLLNRLDSFTAEQLANQVLWLDASWSTAG